jgi:hypothetical protein
VQFIAGLWRILYSRRSRGIALVSGSALAVTIAFMLLAPAYGVTFDEPARHDHGERVLGFLRGELSYKDFAPNQTGRHLYGALFDTSAAWLHERLGGDVWTERHYLGAAFAGVGVLATGLLAVRLAGASVGLLVVVLLALSPRYVGHAPNNPKDIPFAALCMVSLLAFTALRSAPPFLSWGRAMLVGLALALPLNVRPGGLLYIVYFGGLLAAMAIRTRAWAPRHLGPVVARLTLVTAVALLAGTVFWPWARQNPLARPILAIFEASQFRWKGDVLFEGRQISASALPWTYAPVWITITTPVVILSGLLWAAGSTFVARKGERLWRAGLWTVALAPIVLVIVRHSTLYDGWRHLLFVYPPLVILSASGWRDLVVATWKRPVLRAVALAALIAGCAEPLLFMLWSHPNEVVYFNQLAGGPHGAFKRFELDYWGNSLLQATRWSAAAADCTGGRLAVSGWPYELVIEDVSRFPSLYPTQPDEQAHHLHVQLLRDTRRGLGKTIARRDILHVVRTHDGAPLAVVLPGPRFRDVEHYSLAGARDPLGGGTEALCAEIEADFQRVLARSDWALNTQKR